MRQTTVAVGWYADEDGHNNKDVAPAVQKADFLKDFWMPHIRKQLGGMLGAIVVYQSDCSVTAWIPPEKDTTVIHSRRPSTQHHHNDSGSTQLCGAMYAYNNEMNFMFIEQDCFVVGLEDAYRWAVDNKVKMAFSMSNYSEDLSKGEHCFTFVSYEYLPTYIQKLMSEDWHIWNDSRGFPELHMVSMFKDAMTRWPFGYGRKRPINWEEKVYYLQQPTEIELKSVLSQLERRF